MFARNVRLNLKADKAAEFTKTLETTVLPILRKQAGFKDELSFVSPNGTDVVSISMWDTKANADRYVSETYPSVLTSLAAVVVGTPTVTNFEVSNSTFHQIAAGQIAARA